MRVTIADYKTIPASRLKAGDRIAVEVGRSVENCLVEGAARLKAGRMKGRYVVRLSCARGAFIEYWAPEHRVPLIWLEV